MVRASPCSIFCSSAPFNSIFSEIRPCTHLLFQVFNRTLSSITSSFLIVDSQQRHYNVTVQPLFFVLPASGRFSSSIYEVMCSSFEHKRVAAILVAGESPAAFTVAMAAVTSNVPGKCKGRFALIHQYNYLAGPVDTGQYRPRGTFILFYY